MPSSGGDRIAFGVRLRCVVTANRRGRVEARGDLEGNLVFARECECAFDLNRRLRRLAELRPRVRRDPRQGDGKDGRMPEPRELLRGGVGGLECFFGTPLRHETMWGGSATGALAYVGSTNASTLSLTNTGVGGSRYYAVLAVNANCSGDLSGEVSVFVNTDTTAPAIPITAPIAGAKIERNAVVHASTGLKLTPAKGVISGTPKKASTISFTVQVTDSKKPNPKNTATKVLSIAVH
jgi:Putative Ig domain